MRLLRYLWALPWTVVGLVLASGFRRRAFRCGVLVCEEARWLQRSRWPFAAITFGHVVLFARNADDRLIAHELAHVRQYETWGPLFVPAYVAATGWAAVRGLRPHADNPFERAARRRAPSLASCRLAPHNGENLGQGAS